VNNRRKVLDKVFLVTAVIGAVFIITEMIFQSFGRSICPTEGCRIVSQHSRFGDISILLIGLVTFAGLSALSFLAQFRNRPQYNRYINLILVVSLATEGFFVGYQVFRIHTACVVCLITFSFFLLLGLLRLFSGEKEVIAGFLSFAGVLALFYLILPAGGSVRLPEDELILFYSKDCKYCAEVMDKIKAHNLQVAHLLAGEYSGFLKDMQIAHVPTLLVNRKNQKMFLVGRDAIDQYLFCKPKEQIPRETVPKTAAPMKKEPSGKPGIRASEPAAVVPPDDYATQFFIQPSEEEGVCPQDKAEEKQCD
jgi:uncharacterized membrane protein